MLRHWEDVGVIVPARTASGHRDYDANAIDHARIVRIAQRVGFSLHEINELSQGNLADRRLRIEERRRAIRHQIQLLETPIASSNMSPTVSTPSSPNAQVAQRF